MSKFLKIVMVAALALALAAPAIAGDFKFNGYFRLQGIGSSGLKSTTQEDGRSNAIIDQRLRMKLTYGINENVSLVYFGEVDTVWGSKSKGGIGGGGEVGADGVNIETKNAYINNKMGNLNMRAGVQGYKDVFEGAVVWDDMAAGNLSYKWSDSLSTDLLVSKWLEKDSTKWDDKNFYGLTTKFKASDAWNIGGGVYYLNDNDVSGDDFDTYNNATLGLFSDYSFGDFNIGGFFAVQSGKYENNYGPGPNAGTDVDTSSMMLTLKGKMVIPNGDIGTRLIYTPAADDDTDVEGWNAGMDNQGNFEFVYENQSIFLVDIYVNNNNPVNKERYAWNDAVENGYGLNAFILSGNHKGIGPDLYLKWGLGYYLADDDTANVAGDKTTRNDTDLGFEADLMVGKKFNEVFDVSLRGAYASFGDFYKDTVVNPTTGATGDPDDMYKAILMVNVKY